MNNCAEHSAKEADEKSAHPSCARDSNRAQSACYQQSDGACDKDREIRGAVPREKTSREADPEIAAAAERLAGRRVYRAAKRVFDVVFSLLVLVLLCWLYGLIAIAVKVDDPKGSVFFRQRRVGLGGREFTMYKFRSMRPDAESRLGELEALNEKTGPVFKMRDDPRVTRVGRLLRKTSLDELPQFANVLKGDIPSRILKMRPELSAKSMGAFALPAKTSTNENKAFSQVNTAVAASLRTRRVATLHSNHIHSAEPTIFAKPIFKVVAA